MIRENSPAYIVQVDNIYTNCNFTVITNRQCDVDATR